MGFAKKAVAFGSKLNPHSWFLDKRTNASTDFAGQVSGAYDDLYKPKAVAPIPNVDTTQPSYDAADIARRLAKKANGIDSTIRTSPAGALYTAQPKALLGS